MGKNSSQRLKEYRLNNKEELKYKRQEYERKNREKINKQNRLFKKINREKIKKRQNELRKINKEKREIEKALDEYYMKNKDLIDALVEKFVL